MAQGIVRTHVSQEPMRFDPHRDYYGSIAGKLFESKPCGFWYEINGAWRCWLREIREAPIPKHVYTVQINEDQTRLLRLATRQQIHAFQETYGRYVGTTSLSYIAWEEVIASYDGIEFYPYLRGQRRALPWYNALDVASGCLWHLAHVRVAPAGREQ